MANCEWKDSLLAIRPSILRLARHGTHASRCGWRAIFSTRHICDNLTLWSDLAPRSHAVIALTTFCIHAVRSAEPDDAQHSSRSFIVSDSRQSAGWCDGEYG